MRGCIGGGQGREEAVSEVAFGVLLDMTGMRVWSTLQHGQQHPVVIAHALHGCGGVISCVKVQVVVRGRGHEFVS